MFVAIESIIGGGKKPQYKLVSNQLREEGYTVIDQDFPDRASILYENILYSELHEGVSNAPKQRFLMFLLDMLSHAQRINQVTTDGYFISESYFTSTLAYQVLYEKALDLVDALEISKLFKLPTPDLTIYIDTDYQKALENRQTREGYGDRYDYFGGSIDKLRSIDQNFKKLIKDNTYCQWAIVDGNQEEKRVTEDIIKFIRD